MKLNRQVINGSIERDMIIGLITETVFIKKIQPIFKEHLLQTFWTKTISKWCMEYYQEFQEAPGVTIQAIYQNNKELLDDEISDTIHTFLESISDEYNRRVFNTSYVLQEAKKFFKSQNLLALSNNIKADISQGKIDQAELKRLEYEQVSEGVSSAIDVFSEKAVVDTFENIEQDALFKLPGDLGKLIPPFCRGQLVGVTAPMKFGKSFTVIDWAVRAAFNDCKVAFFSMEMTEAEMNARFYQVVTGDLEMLFKSPSLQVEIPYFDEDEEIEIRKIDKKGLSRERVLKKVKAVKTMLRKARIKLFCEPSYSLNIEGIKEKLQLEKLLNGFIADVIVIDYADILGREKNAPKDTRHNINHTWLCSKSLAQELNCCVIMPTQSSRGNFKKDMEAEDISEEIRKLAHVNRMIGINKGTSPGEENELAKKYALRYNMIVDRHKYFDPEKFVRVLKQFQIGKSYLDSRWAE